MSDDCVITETTHSVHILTMQNMHSGECLTNTFCRWRQISELEEVANIDDLDEICPKFTSSTSTMIQPEVLRLKKKTIKNETT